MIVRNLLLIPDWQFLANSVRCREIALEVWRKDPDSKPKRAQYEFWLDHSLSFGRQLHLRAGGQVQKGGGDVR